MADSPFLIVGGGIAGLAAGLGLARIGRPAHIFESAANFDELGAGLQLGPNAVRALQYLDAWDAVAPHCVAPGEIHVRDASTGNILQRVALGQTFERRFGAPYCVIHRPDLHNNLLECIRTNALIDLQANAEVYAVSTGETVLGLDTGEAFQGQAIIIANGIYSRFRAGLLGKPPENFLGHTLHRGLLSIENLPATIDPAIITLWLSPGGHVVHYAVSGGRQFNIVAVVEDPNVLLKTAFPNACPMLAELLNLNINWTLWPALDLEPNPNWARNRTVLIGDAAHASLPYLAQGAAMAIEDACALSTAVQNTKELELAFRNFSGSRFKRTSAVQKKSRQLGRIYHAGGVLRRARNAVLKATPSARFISQLSWIYDWKVTGK